jgi:hypothetical protein
MGKVKKALLWYKEMKGDLLVPRRFAIPYDDERWSSDLWGIKLGFVVHNIRSDHAYVDHRAELVKMGLRFYIQLKDQELPRS